MGYSDSCAEPKKEEHEAEEERPKRMLSQKEFGIRDRTVRHGDLLIVGEGDGMQWIEKRCNRLHLIVGF
jgi:hypothetical protein